MRAINSISVFVCGVLPLLSCAVHDKKSVSNAQLSVEVDKMEIDSGDTVTLTWSAKDAGTCSRTADGQTQDVPTVGRESLTPKADTTYTISCTPAGNGNGASGAASVKVFPLPSGVLTAKVAQIMLGDSVPLDWDCKDSDKAELSANGQPIPEALTLKGSDEYKPTDTTDYELTCSNKRGKTFAAKTTVTVISETSVKPTFGSLEALGQAIDIKTMQDDCGKDCIWQPYDTKRFDASGAPTEDFKEEVGKKMKAAQNKSLLVKSKTVGFVFERSLGYGHKTAIKKPDMDAVCVAGFPLTDKGSLFPETPTFSNVFDNGTETLPKESFDMPVVHDIEVSGKARQGILKKDSTVTVSYKLSTVEATAIADYNDYDHVQGGYLINKTSALTTQAAFTAESLSLIPEDDVITPRAASCSFPSGGVLVDTPPGVVSDATAYSIARTYFPEPRKGYLGNANAYDPKDSLCTKQPYFFWRGAPGDPCTYIAARSIDEKPGFVRAPSPRVVAAQEIVNCSELFGDEARALGLGSEWKYQATQQFFVTDSRFKNGCNGADCAGKEARNAEKDWRFEDIEPGVNKCVDRWKGLDYAAYRSSLLDACKLAPAYTAAAAKAAQKAADDAFATACNETPACAQAVNAMKTIADLFTPQGLSDIVDQESIKTTAAKAQGVGYFIERGELSVTSIGAARSSLNALEAGLPTVQQLHATKRSNWGPANQIIHQRNSIPGFDSYADAVASTTSYKKQVERAEQLIKADMIKIGCSYSAEGKFREYSRIQAPLLSFPPKKQQTFEASVLEDTKVQ
jgi:hypothetical protein